MPKLASAKIAPLIGQTLTDPAFAPHRCFVDQDGLMVYEAHGQYTAEVNHLVDEFTTQMAIKLNAANQPVLFLCDMRDVDVTVSGFSAAVKDLMRPSTPDSPASDRIAFVTHTTGILRGKIALGLYLVDNDKHHIFTNIAQARSWLLS